MGKRKKEPDSSQIMRRFFYDPAMQDKDGQIVIAGPEAHHIRTVLRLRPGTAAELFDGAGNVASAQIEQISSDSVLFRVVARSTEPNAGPPLTLAQAMLKGNKMDMLIQKATELGVHRFVPVISRYCEAQARADQPLERWQRIMLEACKQCRRPVPMRISGPTDLHALTIPAESSKIMPWEEEADCPFFAADFPAGQPVLLLIGPEGGFHPDEVAHARNAGFRTVSLGPRILRAETAALAAVVLAQQAMGNFAASVCR